MTKEAFQEQISLPAEVLALYGPVLAKTIFFDDLSEAETGVNWSQLQAAEEVLLTMERFSARGEGVLIVILAPMFGGKSTVACLLANKRGEEIAVYKHKLDLGRTGERLVSHGGISTKTRLYEGVGDLGTRGVSIVDEFHFNTADTGEEIERFLQEQKENGNHIIASQLDFDFRRKPWPTTEILIPMADQVLVLPARCENCGALAHFTQRNVNGRPAHINDRDVVVGAKDLYKPMCGNCHQVGGKGPSHFQMISYEGGWKMSDLERFKVGYLKGESGEGYPHVVNPNGRIVGFGRGADGGNQLFSSPGKAAEAARQLNSGAAPEDIEAR